ncbi:hypothetical protein FCV25MIE_26020 [Fagus crenata]
MDSPSSYSDDAVQALIEYEKSIHDPGNISLPDDLDQVQMDALNKFWPHDQDQQHVNDAVTSEAHQYTSNPTQDHVASSSMNPDSGPSSSSWNQPTDNNDDEDDVVVIESPEEKLTCIDNNDDEDDVVIIESPEEKEEIKRRAARRAEKRSRDKGKAPVMQSQTTKNKHTKLARPAEERSREKGKAPVMQTQTTENKHTKSARPAEERSRDKGKAPVMQSQTTEYKRRKLQIISESFHELIDHVEETEKPVAELVVNQFNLFNPDNSFHGFLYNTSSADAVESTGRSVTVSPQAPGTASFHISSAQCRSELMLQSLRDQPGPSQVLPNPDYHSSNSSFPNTSHNIAH